MPFKILLIIYLILENLGGIQACRLIGWGEEKNTTLEMLTINLPSHNGISKETSIHYPCILSVNNFNCDYYQITWEKYPLMQMFYPSLINNSLTVKFYYWGNTFTLFFGVKTYALQVFYAYNLTCSSYIIS